MQLIPKAATTKGPAEFFSGDVFYDVITRTDRMRANLVRFTPGAHTAWHRHANGQTLHVTDGVGYVQSRGGELVEIRPGDTIWTPARGVALARRRLGAFHGAPRDVGGGRRPGAGRDGMGRAPHRRGVSAGLIHRSGSEKHSPHGRS